MALAKPSPVPRRPSGVVGLPPAVDFKEAPTVWAFLSDEAYEDGSPRERATITVFAEDGVLKACLNDRQEGRSLFMTGRTLGEILERLETALDSGCAEWNVKGSRAPKGRGK